MSIKYLFIIFQKAKFNSLYSRKIQESASESLCIAFQNRNELDLDMTGLKIC
jgi:hypothetical protein